ncbi:AbaSI family restriction endonuclease [Alteromonas facilis]|uniref:AbaSI family restriction endonuclease n=1 Tax=Alteromonas facilis TaxID=2048004 RepID=UPI000C293EA6|nr:hypothetical protein [Alteromonas facilis]
MDKQEYILRSLQKVSSKKWELFIISRIFHSLNDLDIEFVTQQFVRRPNGKRALTDLFFPQFDLHLEIDEPFHLNQIDNDQKRSQDIVDITGHEVVRIKVLGADEQTKSMESLCFEIDEFVRHLRELKTKAVKSNSFARWDFESRHLSSNVIKRGYVSIKDNVTFRTQVEALKCFGFKGRGYQRGAWKIPDGSEDWVWFPRLYEHGMWHNNLTEQGQVIEEVAINEEGIKSIEQQKKTLEDRPNGKAIVFAKAKDALGFNLLRYVGTFTPDLSVSDETKMIFRRVATIEPVRA